MTDPLCGQLSEERRKGRSSCYCAHCISTTKGKSSFVRIYKLMLCQAEQGSEESSFYSC